MQPDRKLIRVLAMQPALRWLQPMPNLHLLRQLVEHEINRQPADLVVLPETFNGIPSDYDAQAGRLARQFLATLARACKVAVVGGSIDFEHDDGRQRNTCFVLDATGREVGSYHKRVLFADEQHTREAGDDDGVFDVGGLRVGVLICGDIWDPTLARRLADRVDLLCVPAKTTVPTEAHIAYARSLWWNLALSRAMENGLPVVVSDWSEQRHEATILADSTRVRNVHCTSGAASVSDPGLRPDFDAIQKRLPLKQTGILAVDIDLDAARRFRDYRRSVGLLP